MPPNHLIIAAVSAAGVAALAWRARSLSLSGAAAAAFVGFAHFGFGGWPGAAALLLFFATSSALSRLGKKKKDALGFEKGGQRDFGQVLANGGIAAFCACLIPFFPGEKWPIVVLLAALAEANADTWATEIGSLAGHAPRRITDFKKAAAGESGAVSLPGTLAAFAGALLVASAGRASPLSRSPGSSAVFWILFWVRRCRRSSPSLKPANSPSDAKQTAKRTRPGAACRGWAMI